MVKQSDAPIFLVGASRCGNTLLQEALGQHSNIHISSETHWFDDERCQRGAVVETDSERTVVQNWFLSLAHQPFGHGGDPERGWLDRHTFEHEARNAVAENALKKISTSTRDNYFMAYCQLDARQHGKQRWGEKTPRHVFRIDDIVQAFPDAKIICTLRDPRAMVTSYRQWSVRNTHDLYSDQNDQDLMREKQRSKDSYHPVIAALLWRGATRAALKALDEHGSGKIKIILYETLVGEPERTLQDLTHWLDEPFDNAMLDVPLINSSFDDFQRGAGFQKQALNRWQTQLSRSELAVIRLLCKREMKALGYQTDQQGTVFRLLYSIPKLATLPVAVFRAWRANRDRTGNLFKYILRRISV